MIQALQRDPDKAALTGRLAGELAMAETVETALLMRRMLIIGMSEPNAAAQSEALAEGERRIAALDREINALKNEMQLKQALSRNAILTILSGIPSASTCIRKNRCRTVPMRGFISWKCPVVRAGKADDDKETCSIPKRCCAITAHRVGDGHHFGDKLGRAASGRKT